MPHIVAVKDRHAAQRLVRERFISRFRLAAAAFAAVQTVIEPADDVALGWVNIAVFWCSVVVSGILLRGAPTDRTVRRVGVAAMAVDACVVGLILANNQTDPAEPIYLVGILAQLEATMRWPRRGGVIAGVVAGLAAGAWTLVVTARVGDQAEISYATMRAGTIVALGVFLGWLVRRMDDQHRMLQGVLDTSMDLIVLVDSDGTVVSANAASSMILGLTPAELVGQPYERFLHPDDRPSDVRRSLHAVGRDGVLLERRVLRSDGVVRWLELNIAPAQATGAVHISARDITGRRESERRIAESEQRFRSLFEHNTDAVYALDTDGKFTSANPATERLTGYTLLELQSLSFAELIHVEHLDRTRQHFRQALAGRSQNYETAIIAADDRHIDVDVTNTPIVVDGEIVGVFGVAKDVTDRRRLERELGHQATHDGLTRLPNRAYLEMALDAAAVEGADRTLLFIDLDRFKVVNDSLGHRSGDEVLIATVGRLGSHVRPADLLARWAGDEFCVLLESGTPVETAVEIADRLRAALAEPFAVAGRQIRLSASIGVARSDGTGSERLVQIADHAMYQAKRGGRDRVAIYDGRTLGQGPNQIDLEAELRDVIDRRALEVHYQPIVETGTGRVVAVESLVRWPRPDGTFRPPGSFIPLAEESGLIRPLTGFVLDEALGQLAAWDAELGRRDLQCWVNISMADLEAAELPGEVAAALARAGLGDGRLVLEVTETVLMRDIEQVRRNVELLRLGGVSLAIDDFGTGYSSMSQLHRLDVVACKIDRTFVAGALHHARDEAVLRAMVDVGDAFGFPVVAEGVETTAQLALVDEIGCTLSQGFLFAVPGPAEVIAPLLVTGTASDGHTEALTAAATVPHP